MRMDIDKENIPVDFQPQGQGVKKRAGDAIESIVEKAGKRPRQDSASTAPASHTLVSRVATEPERVVKETADSASQTAQDSQSHASDSAQDAYSRQYGESTAQQASPSSILSGGVVYAETPVASFPESNQSKIVKLCECSNTA